MHGRPTMLRAGSAPARPVSRLVPVLDARALLQPVHGHAVFDSDGTATIGDYADGAPARLRLIAGARTRHTIIVGAARSGTTTLLRSLLDGARAADLDTQAIDVRSGALAAGGHAAACSIVAARVVLAEHHDLARTRLAAPGSDRPLRLLAIDDLSLLAADAQFAAGLAELAAVADRCGIVVLASTDRVAADAFGARPVAAQATRRRLNRQLVMLRTTISGSTAGPGGRPLAPIPPWFPDRSSTAGIGYLPHHRVDVPFRAWLP